MGKKIRTIIYIIALAVLAGSLGYIGFKTFGYKKEAKVYTEAAGEFVRARQNASVKDENGAGADKDTETEAVIKDGVSGENTDASEREYDKIPIEVDFDALRKINPDVIGWIYCPDTVINYPVLKRGDNDYYLHRNYKGERTDSGSIFVECANSDGFADSNTIIYGHHMRDGSMFASISKWFSQEYYEEHPVMYLLTPEQDYIIYLFSAYTTAAGSDAYYAIRTPCREMTEYLERAAERSQFTCDVTLPGDERYVMLSTCAYAFENARSVLHGKLVPVY